MPKHTSIVIYTRVAPSLLESIDKAADKYGQDRSSFVRQAIQEKLHRDRDTEAVISSLKSVDKEMQGLRSVAGMLFALQREIARTLLVRLREPQGEALFDAHNRLPQQEKRLLRSVVAEYQRGGRGRIVETVIAEYQQTDSNRMVESE
jgi:uncharacterized protein (DUF1778 family)